MGSESSVTKVDVAIIGAGWYGLVAARTYLRLRPTCNLIIIDSDTTVGGVWSKDRLYPNLVAQVRLGLFNYSDTPMPPHNGDPNDPRVTGDMIHKYLQDYAENHDLIRRIRFGTFVTSATQLSGEHSGVWRLGFRDSSDTLETQKLLVATGVTSIPQMPSIATDDSLNDGSIPVIHSMNLGASFSRLRDDDTLREVVVVGAAKSAYDAVYLLLSMGKKVKWLIRNGGAGPLAILPFRIAGLANTIAVASTRLMNNLSPSILNTRGPLYWLLQRTSPGRWCVGRFWDALDWASGMHAGYGAGDHVAALRPEINRQGVFWAHSGLGVVTLPDFWSTLHSPNLTIVRDEICEIKDGAVKVKERGTASMPADFIIMCTGWGDHFSMFDAHHKAIAGLPAYTPCSDPMARMPYEDKKQRHQVDDINWNAYDIAADRTVIERLPFLRSVPLVSHPELLNPTHQKKWRLYRRAVPVSSARLGDRSLVILGQIHTVQTPLVAEVQSFWAILYLLGEIELPEMDDMATEVSLWNAWTRRRYLNQGQKFPYSLYDFLPYIDSIFEDLGLQSRRKGHVLSEVFSPYHPHDFTGFVDEYLAKTAAKQVVENV